MRCACHHHRSFSPSSPPVRFYDGLTSALGTLVLSKFVAQAAYERHISSQDKATGGTTCYGKACFRESHLIIAALTATCCVTALLALWQTRPLYKKIIRQLED